jgi:hypothetical protein
MSERIRVIEQTHARESETEGETEKDELLEENCEINNSRDM